MLFITCIYSDFWPIYDGNERSLVPLSATSGTSLNPNVEGTSDVIFYCCVKTEKSVERNRFYATATFAASSAQYCEFFSWTGGKLENKINECNWILRFKTKCMGIKLNLKAKCCVSTHELGNYSFSMNFFIRFQIRLTTISWKTSRLLMQVFYSIVRLYFIRFSLELPSFQFIHQLTKSYNNI